MFGHEDREEARAWHRSIATVLEGLVKSKKALHRESAPSIKPPSEAKHTASLKSVSVGGENVKPLVAGRHSAPGEPFPL
jgi:hypothetical protein